MDRINRDEITILHVSDTQFGRHHCFGREDLSGDDARYDTLLKRLTLDLDELRDSHGVAPDLVALTGDLAEWGMDGEFSDVLAFCNGLRDHLKLGVDRVLVVPGNHDINRPLCDTISGSNDPVSKGLQRLPDPPMKCDRSDRVRSILEPVEGSLETGFDFDEAVENNVAKDVLAKVIPEVLDGVQLGAVGWEPDQSHPRREHEVSRHVPARAVHDHHEPFAREGRGDLTEMPTRCETVAAQRCVPDRRAVARAHGQPGIDVLADLLLPDTRPKRSRGPTRARRCHPPEPRLILEEDADATPCSTSDLLRYECSKFFSTSANLP